MNAPGGNEDRRSELEELSQALLQLRREMMTLVEESEARLRELHPNFQESGRNLLHYLALRRHDLRPLQRRLAALGLSSLGRAEPHVLSTVENVLRTLQDLCGEPAEFGSPSATLTFEDGCQLLTEHTERLLDRSPEHRQVRIMVTMPSEAANDYHFVHSLLEMGMDCMRINCAHDGPEAWNQMIRHLDRARKLLGKPCRLQMDLTGAKLRTGPLQPGPAVMKLRPGRDRLGQVTAPLRIWLTSEEAPQPAPSQAAAEIRVSAEWLALLAAGDRIRFRDARDSGRSWKVIDVSPKGTWVEGRKTSYLSPGIELRLDRDDKPTAVVGPLPTQESFLLLHAADLLWLTPNELPGHPAKLGSDGQVLTPATIGCTLPEVFADVRTGEPIWFDDGRIGGEIERIEDDHLVIRITRTAPGGGKLRADKGINLPDSELHLSTLNAKDLKDLAFAVQHADIIGLSFANQDADVELLQQQIERLGPRRPAIMLKVETRRGFDNLPSMLLAAMRQPSCGVMIARGDLAVEAGFVRLAEMQEEILWLCEAAHVPVIWATQVLETLAKEGMPSRAEITDAAMGDRAECVMLNKGPHILTAVEVLDDILQRMQAHQAKKQSMLRELKVAHR